MLLGDGYAELRQRIFDCVSDRRRRADHAALADTPVIGFDARRRLYVVDLDLGYLHRGRNQIVHEGAGLEVAVVVVGGLLVQHRADALRHAASNLTFDYGGVDQLAAVLDHEVAVDGHLPGLEVDLDPAHVCCLSPPAFAAVPLAGHVHGAAPRHLRAPSDGLVGDLGKRYRDGRCALDEDPPTLHQQVVPRRLEEVRGYVDAGVAEGATLVVDGRGHAVDGHGDGFFLGGCLFDHVTPTMTIYREEIFGPVLSVVRVPDFETALKLVNEHEYGNGTAIFTRDGGAARAFAHRVQAGMVGVNVPIPVPMAYYSFGGWKDSLFGDLHAHGREGVLFYTQGKVVTTRWPARETDPSRPDYGFPASR